MRPRPDWLPRSILTLAGGYSTTSFLADLIAGVTVGLVALPLAMAFAIVRGCRRRPASTARSSPAF